MEKNQPATPEQVVALSEHCTCVFEDFLFNNTLTQQQIAESIRNEEFKHKLTFFLEAFFDTVPF
jgi:hypothetical protein